MIMDVLPPWIDYIPGSFSIPPDNIYVNATGYTFLEWNYSSLLIGETWTVSFDITCSEVGLKYTNDYISSRVNYTNWHDDPIEILFPPTQINVVVGEPRPPELYIDIRDNSGNPDGKGDNVYLYWVPPTTPDTSHYLLYRSPTQTGFDFSSPWRSTLTHSDNGVFKLRNTWNDTNVAVDSAPYEYYYCIRAVNSVGEISDSSRTVGRWTTTYQQGTSTFSLPLEPIESLSTDSLVNDMTAGTGYIKWMDPINHVWLQHGSGAVNNTVMTVGKGYEVDFTGQTKYTFTGMPGAMILYDNVTFGFNITPGSDDEDDLTASEDGTGSVTLTWKQPLSMSPGVHEFRVLRSSMRDGFWDVNDYDIIAVIPVTAPGSMAFYTDVGNATAGTELYYMILPIEISSGYRGSSSYSIGVWTADILGQYDTFGLPLKPASYDTADWWCDNFGNTVGINYYHIASQRWSWHSTRMPFGAFDPLIEMILGYQISTTAPTKYSFVGV
jgi:hypothetical protein